MTYSHEYSVYETQVAFILITLKKRKQILKNFIW